MINFFKTLIAEIAYATNMKIRPNLSASKVAEIEELLIEILLRVPPKAMLKSKRVSKQWQSIISDSKFCLSYARFRPKVSLLLKEEGERSKVQVISLNRPIRMENNVVVKDFIAFNGHHTDIIQSCKGLLLCKSSLLLLDPRRDDSTFDGHLRCFAYCVCNPTTGQFRRIVCPSSLSPPSSPNPYLIRYTHALFSVSLVFNPQVSNHYKVVFIFDWDAPKEYANIYPAHYGIEIFIYSSETQSWSWQRRDELDYGRTSSMVKNNGPFCCNGVIHWFRYDSSYRTGFVLRFDPYTMVFETIDFPYSFYFFGFAEYRGNLQMITREFDRTSLEFIVWEVSLDYSKFYKRYCIDLESIRRVHPSWNISPLSIFYIICGENIKDTEFVISVENMAVIYNHSDRTYRVISEIERTPQNQRYYSNISQCRRPLACYYKAFEYLESYCCV
ncbi:F-box protein At5g07610-like [Mercurialis annua]|uniref:F-box protein At5g07610-like n=1 Tax=Mercurialis annua TaxID=3986 RepID=UPI002160272D|nr:F-box protein At5g07610-like [Mercurialis annua]